MSPSFKRRGIAANFESDPKQATEPKNAATRKMIEAAAAAYLADVGHSPARLDDLVAAGYLSSQDIVDQDGNQLGYTPEVPEQTTGTTVTIMTKSCGRCGKPVANTSKGETAVRIVVSCGAMNENSKISKS